MANKKAVHIVRRGGKHTPTWKTPRPAMNPSARLRRFSAPPVRKRPTGAVSMLIKPSRARHTTPRAKVAARRVGK
jgi:hypothetical protein